MDLPGGTEVKNLPANAGDAGSNPGSGRSAGGGNGNPTQCFCLENSTDKKAWWYATVHGVAKGQTRLSTHGSTYFHTHTHTHTYVFKSYICVWFKETSINGNKLHDRKEVKAEWIVKGTEKMCQEGERNE